MLRCILHIFVLPIQMEICTEIIFLISFWISIDLRYDRNISNRKLIELEHVLERVDTPSSFYGIFSVWEGGEVDREKFSRKIISVPEVWSKTKLPQCGEDTPFPLSSLRFKRAPHNLRIRHHVAPLSRN